MDQCLRRRADGAAGPLCPTWRPRPGSRAWLATMSSRP